MRILIISVPSVGHVRSMVPVAKVLAERGHELYWAANPAVEYVASSGAKLVNVLPRDLSEDTARFSGNSAREIDFWFLEHWFIPIAEKALGPTLDCARALEPDLILTDATALWGPMVAESLGQPWATYCPGLFTSSQERHLVIRGSLGPQQPVNWARHIPDTPSYWQFERRLNVLRRAHDLPAADNLGKVSETLILCFTTRPIEFGGAGLPAQARCVGPVFGSPADIDPFSARIPDIPEGEEPLVYVTLGNVFAGRGGVVDLILEGLNGLPLRIFVAKTRGEALKTRDRVAGVAYATEPISQARVLQQASLVVGSGGFNTVHESLCHGVPVVALPIGGDEPALARRIEELGLGICLGETARTPQAVRAAVERLLSDATFAANAGAFAKEARIADSVTRSVRLLEALCRDGAIHTPVHQKIFEALPELPQFAPRFNFIDTGDHSVVVRSYIEDFSFQNEATVEALRWLWKTLDGKKSLGEILDDWAGKANLVSLMALLGKEGILEDNMGSIRLSQDIQDRYDDQLTLFSHAHAGEPAPLANLRGTEFQERLLNARVCVVGAGILGSNVVRSLCQVGVGAVNVLAGGSVDSGLIARGGWYNDDQVGLPRLRALSDQARALRPDVDIRTYALPEIEGTAAEQSAAVPGLEGVHLLIVAQDLFDPILYARIDEACHANRIQWTSLRRNALNIEIGPAIVPYQTGCFHCYEQRHAGNSPNGYPHLRSDAGWFHLAIGSEWVVLEAIKLLTGFGEAISLGKVLIFNPLTMTLSHHRIFRLPRCPRCARQSLLPEEIPWRPQP